MRTHSILAIVFIVSASLLSQTSLKHFTFVVTDRAGAPIPQAFVHIQHWDLARGIPGAHWPRLIQDGAASTDAEGRVSFDLAPAIYEVFASAPSFAPAAASVGNQFETEHVFKLAVIQGDWVEVESPPK
jgi:hypothetical protein